MDKPRVSFIIPCKNGEDVIGKCLQSIQEITEEGDEIIVVDNCSTDGTADIASRFPEVIVLSSNATTISGVRNHGAREASCDWLAFVDSDVILGSNWRASLTRVFKNSEVMSTGSGPHLPTDPTWLERAWICGWGSVSGPVEYVWTGNLIVRAEAYRAIDGFDESLETDEDTDFCWRLRELFGRHSLVGAEDMEAVHLGNSKTVKQFWRRQHWLATSIVDAARIHGWDKALAMTLAFVCFSLIGLIFLLYHRTLFGCMAFIGSITLIPSLTALYRMRKRECLRWFPHLAFLYTVYYLARTVRILQVSLSGKRLGGSRGQIRRTAG